MTEHLLAAVVDQLAVANWMFATVNRDEDAETLPHPDPLPRPGIEPPPQPESDAATPVEIAAFFGSP